MNSELKQAVQERVEHGYSKEKIAEELHAAGYDSATVDQIYAAVTSAAAIPSTSIPAPVKPKKGLNPWLVAFAPFLFFIGLIVLWGVVNLLAGGAGPTSGVLEFINAILIPFLIGLCFLAVPICIIWAMVIANSKYDGTLRCGNCEYSGVGESGRSVWAQVLAWIMFPFFWPITLIYYLVTHRYRCPRCKSTFVGLRDVHGHYHAPGGGLGVVGVIVISLVVVAIMGILAAAALSSLNDARGSAREAQLRALDTDLPQVQLPKLDI